MKRFFIVLFLLFTFSYGNEIVGSSNIFELEKNLELKISALNTRVTELKNEGLDEIDNDKVIVNISKERDNLLKNILVLFQERKIYASNPVSFKNKKINLLTNLKDNKRKKNGIAYIYRDKLLLAILELDNDLELNTNTLNSLLDSSVIDKVYISYFQGIINSLNEQKVKYNHISDFINKNKDKKIKKYTDVENNYNNLMLKIDSQLVLYSYLLDNVDTLNSRDIVLDTFKVFSISESINSYMQSNNLYFELYLLKIFGFDEVVITPAKLIILSLILVIGYLSYIILRFIIENLFLDLLSRFSSVKIQDGTGKRSFAHSLVEAIRKPLILFAFTFFLKVFAKVLFSPVLLPEYLITIFELLNLFSAVWLVWRLITKFESQIIIQIKRNRSDATEESVEFLVLTVKIGLSIFFIFMFITLLFPSIITYAAGAGFLIAFILKDSVNNYLATSKVIAESNIKVGDWIKDYNKKLEGTVHKIGMFNTRIIMFDGSSLTIPNSYLVSAHIINYSRRSGRQIKFYFYLSEHESTDNVRNIISDINVMLLSHENLRHPEDIIKYSSKYRREHGISATCFARLKGLDNGLKIQVYCNTNKDDWMFQLETHEDIMLNIMDICRKYNTNIIRQDTLIDMSEKYKKEVKR